MTDLDIRRVASDAEAEKAAPGEIMVSDSGSVVIGVPTVVVAAEAPQPGGEE